MDFQELFKHKAIKDFHLHIDDYIMPLNIDEFVKNIIHVTDIWSEKDNWTKCIEYLKTNLEKIKSMVQNPETFTIEDRESIRRIKRYLMANSGKQHGYYIYRKKFTEEVIGEFYSITIQNRMIMLTNIDLIEQQTNKLIKYFEEKLLQHKQFALINQKFDKNKWAGTYLTCECGIPVTKSHKSRHNKSKFHINYINSKN